MIPGFDFFISSNELTDFTLVDSSIDTSGANFTFPSDVEVGDFLMVIDFCGNNTSTAPTSVTPAGFTLYTSETDVDDDSGRLNISYKYADGTEGGNTLTGMDDSYESKLSLVFRPNRGVTSDDLVDTDSDISQGLNPSVSLTDSGDTTPSITLFLATYFDNNTPTRTTTPTVTTSFENTSGCDFWAGVYIRNADDAEAGFKTLEFNSLGAGPAEMAYAVSFEF